jgi:alanine dehydrogenase
MLYLTEEDVDRLLSIEEAIDAVRDGFKAQAAGKVALAPRSRVRTERGTLNMMGCTVDEMGYSAVKSYYGSRLGAHFIITLFSTEDTKPVAIIEASRLGQLRTGAASAVATELIASKEASVLGCIGSGYQAETQVEAITKVRPIKKILVKGRREERVHAFINKLQSKTGLEIMKAEDKDFLDADIIVTATTSRTPVLPDRFIAETCHINAVGANRIESTELELETVCSARKIVVDSLEQSKIESGDIMQALNAGCLNAEEINELWEGFSSGFRENRRATTQRTLFKSLGIALEDLVSAVFVYSKAIEKGVGTRL